MSGRWVGNWDIIKLTNMRVAPSNIGKFTTNHEDSIRTNEDLTRANWKFAIKCCQQQEMLSN
jgi:hypothetical protein